jgi:hypothetical protein
MNLILTSYAAALGAAAYAFVYGLGGRQARVVLTLGAYPPPGRHSRAGIALPMAFTTPDRSHKRRHRTFPVPERRPAPPTPPMRPVAPPARGVARVPEVLTPDGVVEYQHAFPYSVDAPAQLDSPDARLLAALRAAARGIQVDGLGTGEWRVA